MKKLLSVAFILALVMAALPVGGTPAQAQDASRVVLAFYYGWYNAGTWSDGRLADTPAEPYDSGDRTAMARQIAQAQSAGIDAFVMSWYGPASEINTTIFAGLLEQSAAMGFHAAADVDLGSEEFNATTADALNTMQFLIANLIHHPGYYRYNGKPVIFFWNQGRFTAAEWSTIRDTVDPAHDTIWVAEGDALDYLGPFDAINLYNVAWSRNPATTAATWAQRAADAGAYYIATAMPGWDDTRMGRGEAGFATDRQEGAYFRASFEAAAASQPHMIIITSWNEFFEGSYIEPSQNYGTFYLDLARELITAYKSGGLAPSAPEGGASPVITGTAGIVASPTVDTLNVRSAPSTDGERVGQVTLGGQYPILGRSADGAWWLIDFGGGQGWIASAYARYEGGDINAVPVQ